MTFVLKGHDDKLAEMLSSIMACEGVDSYNVSCEIPQGARGPGGQQMLAALIGAWGALALAAAGVGEGMVA